MRGVIQGVPTAQEFAEQNPNAGYDCKLVSKEVLQRGLDRLEHTDIDELSKATPLYLYVLIEAAEKQNGRCFGPVGSTIIGETIVAAMKTVSERDDDLKQAEEDWGEFVNRAMPETMADLIDWDVESSEVNLASVELKENLEYLDMG
jgi:hypothetical protein